MTGEVLLVWYVLCAIAFVLGWMQIPRQVRFAILAYTVMLLLEILKSIILIVGVPLVAYFVALLSGIKGSWVGLTTLHTKLPSFKRR